MLLIWVLFCFVISFVFVDALSVDTCKTYFQGRTGSSRDAFKALVKDVRLNGVGRLYAGAGTMLAGTMPARAVYFSFYEMLKTNALQNVDPAWAPVIHFSAAFVSECAAACVYIPFDIVKQRMQLNSERYPGTFRGMVTIAKTDGLRGLWTGFVPTITRDAFFAATLFGSYEYFKSTYRGYVGRKLGTGENLVLGGAAGVISAATTCPLDVIKTRIQTQEAGVTFVRADGTPVTVRYNGYVDAATKVVRMEGWKALYKGVVPRVGWIGPNSAVTFAVYEALRTALGMPPEVDD